MMHSYYMHDILIYTAVAIHETHMGIALMIGGGLIAILACII